VGCGLLLLQYQHVIVQVAAHVVCVWLPCLTRLWLASACPSIVRTRSFNSCLGGHKAPQTHPLLHTHTLSKRVCIPRTHVQGGGVKPVPCSSHISRFCNYQTHTPAGRRREAPVPQGGQQEQRLRQQALGRGAARRLLHLRGACCVLCCVAGCVPCVLCAVPRGAGSGLQAAGARMQQTHPGEALVPATAPPTCRVLLYFCEVLAQACRRQGQACSGRTQGRQEYLFG